MHESHIEELDFYLNGIEAYLPLESIQAQLQESPHSLSQMDAFDDEEIAMFVEKVKSLDMPKEYIDRLLETELFKDKKELLNDKN